MEFSGQPEDYVKHSLYDDVMVITLDPAKKRIVEFYETMKANGDIDPQTPHDIAEAVDTGVYEDALKVMLARYPDDPILLGLLKSFTENN